jgi:phage gp36-like protein
VSQYVTPSELVSYGANPIALAPIAMTLQTAACTSASSTMDAYFRGRYPLPFTSWGEDVKMRAAHIATWLLLASRGFDPEAGYDSQIDSRYQEAIRWCEHVQRQAVHPDVTYDAPASPKYNLPAVLTHCKRGW